MWSEGFAGDLMGGCGGYFFSNDPKNHGASSSYLPSSSLTSSSFTSSLSSSLSSTLTHLIIDNSTGVDDILESRIQFASAQRNEESAIGSAAEIPNRLKHAVRVSLLFLVHLQTCQEGENSGSDQPEFGM